MVSLLGPLFHFIYLFFCNVQLKLTAHLEIIPIPSSKGIMPLYKSKIYYNSYAHYSYNTFNLKTN